MLEILQFIFSSFWIWLGTVILVRAFVTGIFDMIEGIVKVTNSFKNIKVNRD